MMDETSQLPRHIAQLFIDIRGSTNLEACLTKAAPLCQRDLSLLHLFRGLGYSPDSGRFLRPLDRNKVLNALLEEYMTQSAFEPLESLWGSSSQGVKGELLRTYIDNQIDQLSPPEQLGLVDYCLPDLTFGFEENTLSTMWSCADPSDEPGSPGSCRSQNPPSVCGVSSSRKSRGLRVISVRVNELVALKKQTSYKEVADQLIAELALPPGPENFKEEKNVRRRVYDALNVLISAGVIDKVGKLVKLRKSQKTSEQANLGVDFTDRCDIEGRDLRGMSLVERMQSVIADKSHRLLDLVKKSQALKGLIKRNSASASTCELIKLPFMIVVPEGSVDDVRTRQLGVKADSSNSHVEVRLSSRFDLVSDLDVLVGLDLPLGWEGVPPDIKRLCKIVSLIKH
jgi:hypothetical protein